MELINWSVAIDTIFNGIQGGGTLCPQRSFCGASSFPASGDTCGTVPTPWVPEEDAGLIDYDWNYGGVYLPKKLETAVIKTVPQLSVNNLEATDSHLLELMQGLRSELCFTGKKLIFEDQ